MKNIIFLLSFTTVFGFFGNSQNVDVAIGNLATNFAPCSLTNSGVVVSFDVFNHGGSQITQNQVQLSYQIGGITVNQVLTNTIAPNDSVLFSFNTTVNLLANSGNKITISASLVNDSDSSNNQIITRIKSAQVNLPYFEDFEGHTMGSTFDKDGMQSWTRIPDTNTTGGNYMWHVQKGSAPYAFQSYLGGGQQLSTATGPNGDHTLASSIENGRNGTYMLINSAVPFSQVPHQDAILELPCNGINSNGNAVVLEFYYHQSGAFFNNLFIDIHDGNNWILGVDSVYGNNNNPIGNSIASIAWNKKTTLLDTAQTSSTFRVRFRAKPYWDSWSNQYRVGGDFGLDDIKIYETSVNDISLKNIVPTSRSCDLSAEQLGFQVENVGQLALDTFFMKYEIKYTDTNSIITNYPTLIDTVFNLWFQSPLSSGSSANYSSPQMDVSAPGKYDFVLSADLKNDSNSFNDTLRHSFINYNKGINSCYDFNEIELGRSADAYFEYAYPNGIGSYNFSVVNGVNAPFSAASQDSLDHFVLSENNGPAVYGSLSTSCLDIMQLNGAFQEFSFDYRLPDTNVMLVVAGLSNGLGVIVDTLRDVSTTTWHTFRYSLYQHYGDYIQFSVEPKIISGFPTNIVSIALDNICFTAPGSNQVALAKISGIDETGCEYSTNESIDIEVVNTGNDVLDSIFVKVMIDKDSISTSGSNHFSDSIWLINQNISIAGSRIIALNQSNMQFDLSVKAKYFITVEVSTTKDYTSADGQVKLDIINKPKLTLPFIESFDTTSLKSFEYNFNVNIRNSFYPSWDIINGNPNSLQKPHTDHTLGNANGRFLTSNNTGSAASPYVVMSHCVDVSNATNLSIDYHVYNFDDSRWNPVPNILLLQVLNGANWITVDSIGTRLQSTLSEPWVRRYINLPSNFGGTLRYRFLAYGSGNYSNSVSVDDIAIRDLLLTNVEEIMKLDEFSLYPNPSEGKFQVNVSEKFIGKLVEIFDVSGSLVKSQKINQHNFKIDLEQMKKGVYFLKIEGNPNTKRLILI